MGSSSPSSGSSSYERLEPIESNVSGVRFAHISSGDRSDGLAGGCSLPMRPRFGDSAAGAAAADLVFVSIFSLESRDASEIRAGPDGREKFLDSDGSLSLWLDTNCDRTGALVSYLDGPNPGAAIPRAVLFEVERMNPGVCDVVGFWARLVMVTARGNGGFNGCMSPRWVISDLCWRRADFWIRRGSVKFCCDPFELKNVGG